MSLEIYWKKALEQTRLSIDDKSLYPLKTDIITKDLYEKYGELRVLDTPIAENSFTGMAVGAAMTGLRPIVE